MRNFTLVLLLVGAVLFNVNVHAQRTCAAHDHMLQQMEKSPKMRANVEKLQNFTRNYVENYTMLKAGQIRTIPVYVHVIYKTSQENISDAQIQSQIDVMNIDYGGTNPDLSAVPTEFTSVTATGTGISFVLAGITRKSSTRTSWGTDDDMKKSSLGGVDPITPDTHMNMWICNIGGGILGYAQFPGGAPATDGVVFSPQYCGSSDYDDGSFYLSAPFDKGRTAVHEIGHYLNLRHIWGDGACSASDYVNDTPSAEGANYNCPSHPHNTCGSNDMFMNYMDYVDDGCMYMFSQGQSDRMWACLTSTRANLGYSDGNVAPIAKANGPYTGDSSVALNFSSAGSVDSDGSIAGYTWDFGDGSTSTQANPTHTYASDGIYNVSLTVTDDLGKTGVDNTTATIGNVCSGIQACDGNITLTLITDNYGSETSWELKNSAGSVVESGSNYGKNTTYTFNWTLAEDTYTFTINDSYGDGICCSYGNGSYTLKDGCNNTLKSGGAFSSTEATDFCSAGGGTANVAPAAEANGPYTVNEGTAVNFSSAGSSDSDGTIASYAWNFGDGNTSIQANPTHTYAAGNYTATLTVTDNGGLTGNDQATVTVNAVSNNVAPTAQANGPYTADEAVNISFSSAGSDDSDGFIQNYAWDFGDGNTSTQSNPSHAYTNAGNYTATLTVTDDGGLTGTDVADISITTASGGGSATLEENYFESGWDGWSDGGSDCARYGGSRSYEGNYSIRLRDNSGTSSAMTSGAHNVSDYSQITVDFYFYPYSMENGEDFWLRYYDGNSWNTVASWSRGTDFNNGSFYHATVNIASSNYNFPSNARFRFQCDASGNADYIYIDQVTITASNSAKSSGNITELVANQRRVVDLEKDMDLVLYPNPVDDILYVKLNTEEQGVMNIFNTKGQLLKVLDIHSDVTPVDVSELAAGVYILKVTSEDEVFVKRFVKK